MVIMVRGCVINKFFFVKDLLLPASTYHHTQSTTVIITSQPAERSCHHSYRSYTRCFCDSNVANAPTLPGGTRVVRIQVT